MTMAALGILCCREVAVFIIALMVSTHPSEVVGSACHEEDHCVAESPGSSLLQHVYQRSVQPGVPSPRAFVTMLCLTPDSSFDRADGLGSEVGALVHGHMINHMSSKAVADNVLLHLTGGSCMKKLRLGPQLNKTFDRIIEFDGSTSRFESVISTFYKDKPHLWMKLLVMNMTEYRKVMWLGFDTFPVRPLTSHGFDCESYPCIDGKGNADLMVFEPNAKEMERVTSYFEEHYKELDGIPGKDMNFVHHFYPNMSSVPLTFDNDRQHGPKTDIVHFTMFMKPWFQAYCRSLDPHATLPGADFLGTKSEGGWCRPGLLNTPMYYAFWQAAVEACKPEDDPIGIFSLKEYLQFDAVQACSDFVRTFPALKPWCH